MKIVVNRCYGGFSLSPLAQREYLKRKGKKAFFYELTKYEKGAEEYTRIDNITNCKKWGLHTITKDLGKKCSTLPNKDYWSCRNIERTDPILVKIVERLGEKADGECAKLEIVEVPNGISWTLSDYDGIETVEEEHRSW